MRQLPGKFIIGAVLIGAVLVMSGCGPCPVPERSAAPAATSVPEPEPPAPPIRLQPASGSGVLILEEDTGAAWQQEPAPDDEGLSGRAAPPLPAGHQGFRDHQVVLYVPDPAAGLDSALQAAGGTGGQVISYPISGFEDLGPDERTLVFDARTYPLFLRRLQAEGEAVYEEIGPCDFVTVRLSVKEKKD